MSFHIVPTFAQCEQALGVLTSRELQTCELINI